VIGGGAAGYFAAIQCATVLSSDKSNSKQHEVIIFESTNSPLSKVLVSGGGRCNVQHNPLVPVPDISRGYPRGSRELIGPLSSGFTPLQTAAWFESRGVKLKTETDGRVFPTTDKASTIKVSITNDCL
jgi:predicted flavoprotein YhiN